MSEKIQGFNTASGKHCCNETINSIIVDANKNSSVSIPQAVSTVATLRKSYLGTMRSVRVSIPQAVSTVATSLIESLMEYVLYSGFNTASGKHCCNANALGYSNVEYNGGFNTASGKHCCNSGVWKASIYAGPKDSFGKPQTVNGKISPH